jgi:hypothetical protein
MTKQYDNTNTGTLAKNGMKQKDTHPDVRGKINVDGKWFWLSGWNKFNGNDGSKFISLATTAMSEEDVEKYCGGKKAEPKAPEAKDDDII